MRRRAHPLRLTYQQGCLQWRREEAAHHHHHHPCLHGRLCCRRLPHLQLTHQPCQKRERRRIPLLRHTFKQGFLRRRRRPTSHLQNLVPQQEAPSPPAHSPAILEEGELEEEQREEWSPPQVHFTWHSEREWLHSRAPRRQWMEEEEEEVESLEEGQLPSSSPEPQDPVVLPNAPPAMGELQPPLDAEADIPEVFNHPAIRASWAGCVSALGRWSRHWRWGQPRTSQTLWPIFGGNF
ncbi:unnamed protein product, partial [Staurois parvus]